MRQYLIPEKLLLQIRFLLDGIPARDSRSTLNELDHVMDQNALLAEKQAREEIESYLRKELDGKKPAAESANALAPAVVPLPTPGAATPPFAKTGVADAVANRQA